MEELRPLVHIGYHKTGTTFLQQRVLNRHDLGFTLYAWEELPGRLVNIHPLDFSPEEARLQLRSWGEDAARLGLVPVFSHERLSGYPASGGFDSKELADRLLQVFPDARILIVIREQASMLASCYGQYIRDGGGKSLASFLNPRVTGNSRVPVPTLDFFSYERLIRYYVRLFGPENVLVLPYELLRGSPDAFMGSIVRFSGARERAASRPADALSADPLNVSPSRIQVAVRCWANRLFNENPLNPVPILWNWPLACRALAGVLGGLAVRAPRVLEERVAARQRRIVGERLGSRYSEGNRWLAEITGLDLRELGYRMPEGSVSAEAR